MSPLAAPAKVAFVGLHSSAIHGSRLPALYTCDGRDIPPPLTWGAVPSEVHELALFALAVNTREAGQSSLAVVWAMAGVNPALHHLSAGEVPPGAFLLTTTDGQRRYSICPPRGQTKSYEFALLALPSRASATPAIPGVSLLRNLAAPSAETHAPAEGVLSIKYTRR